MPLKKCLLKPVLFSLIFLLFGTGFVAADEIDDASLFVEAFNAYQNNDYLLTIEKIDALRQLFPDSPLQDVTLLLLARAGLKSGDNDLAARTMMHFNREYPSSPLRAGAGKELTALAARRERGELPANDSRLAAEARLARTARVTQQQPAAVNVGQERTAESGRSDKERQKSDTAARDSIRFAISIINNDKVVEVGKSGLINFEVINQGKAREEFRVEVIAATEFGAYLERGDRTRDRGTIVSIGTDAPYTGTVSYRMPSDKVDGHKGSITLRAVSSRFSDIEQSQEAVFSSAGPLLRVIARPTHQKLKPGEKTRFRVVVINAGSLAARSLTVKVSLPPQADFLSTTDRSFRQEAPGVLSFAINILEVGQLAEFGIDVKVREDSRSGQELRSRVEVVNTQQQTRETYTSAAVVVE